MDAPYQARKFALGAGASIGSIALSLPDENSEVKASAPVTSSSYHVLLIETPANYEQGLLTAGGR